MATRIIIEIDEDQLSRIERRKKDFLGLLKGLSKDPSKAKELSTRFGANVLNIGDSSDRVVLNIEGETVYRR